MLLGKRLAFTALTGALALLSGRAAAQETPDDTAGYPLLWEARATLGAGSGDFAPSYASAHIHGRVFSSLTALAEASLWRPMSLDRRFNYGFGATVAAGWAKGAEYARYDAATNSWSTHRPSPARLWLQQLWGEVKWRGVFLTVGMKEYDAPLVNNRLSGGDLVHSGNTRPIPQARIGFVDFQNIPFTNGWVQIQGEVGYGRYTDSDWWEDRANLWNYHVTTGQWYNYKRCFFRTKPSMPLSITVGMQAAAQFGGTERHYSNGQVTINRKHGVDAESFVHALLPWSNGKEGFYEGNHLGSWDFHLRYRLPSGHELKAYVQKPWEDGSGIGWMNGFDGLWGLEWNLPADATPWLRAVVAEYLDLTNQSGPTHYAPGDFPNADLTSEATGADDYYNNYFYNSYACYGMSQGSPLVMAPIYNRDGYMAYVANRMRAVHIGAEGSLPGTRLDWRLRAGWRKGWGNAFIILPEPISSVSAAVDIDWRVEAVPGLTLNAMLAFDSGSMPADAFGAMITVKYSGLWNL